VDGGRGDYRQILARGLFLAEDFLEAYSTIPGALGECDLGVIHPGEIAVGARLFNAQLDVRAGSSTAGSVSPRMFPDFGRASDGSIRSVGFCAVGVGTESARKFIAKDVT
jgi:hypothetical protein